MNITTLTTKPSEARASQSALSKFTNAVQGSVVRISRYCESNRRTIPLGPGNKRIINRMIAMNRTLITRGLAYQPKTIGLLSHYNSRTTEPGSFGPGSLQIDRRVKHDVRQGTHRRICPLAKLGTKKRRASPGTALGGRPAGHIECSRHATACSGRPDRHSIARSR